MSRSHLISRITLKRVLPYAVLLAAWALFFWRFAAPNLADRLTYPAGDFTSQFGVFRDIAYRSIVAGRLPLWAECLDAGYPFHADPQAQVFYPPLWLIFGTLRVMGWGHFPIEALVAEAALHYLAASIFLFLFLSSLSLRRSAVLLGALTFTYGGFLTGYPPLQTAVLETAAWLPLTLLAAGHFADSRRLRHLALTALGLAVAFLAGHPQTFVYVALLTLAYFAFRAAQAQWKFAASVGSVTALVSLTTALAAVQLLPTLQFILNSTRASLSFSAAAGGLPFGDVVQFLLTGYMSYWNPLYVGILPLGLALLALTRPKPEVGFWAAVALVCLVLTFGAKGAAFDAAYWLVPGLSFFHGPERLALGVSFALAVLAAFGAHHLRGSLPRPARRALERFIVIGGVLLALALVSLVITQYLVDLNPAAPGSELPSRFGLLAYGLGLAVVALLIRARVPALRRWAPALFIIAAALDLFAVNRPTNVVPVFSAYPPSPIVTPIQSEAGFFRVQNDAQLPGHASCAYGYRGAESITPYHVATYAAFGRVPERVRWQLLGVSFFITWRQQMSDAILQPVEVASAPALPRADNRAGLTKVFRFEGNPPRRAFFVHSVEVADGEQAYDLLSAPDFDPFSSVVLAQPLATTPGQEGETLSVESDQPGRIQVKVQANAAGVLVLSEAYFPGWRASVDGQAIPVLRADGALIAVPLPSGRHQVKFVYQPPALLWGGLISIAALILAFGLAAVNPIRR